MWAGVAFSLLVIGLFAWLILSYNRARMLRTLRGGAVAQVRGPIRLTTEGGKSRSYYFYAGSQRFQLDAKQHSLLSREQVGGQQAVVYYTTPWRHVLSVELLPNVAA